ncbi:hypothetical protein E2562_017563 [Oryza meyeriana var. granulata]|uniref:Uncharacterized protein n=1 Tax=Oryza meyeriana var. granulata TaxID=110450 RepID=A0A6G1C6Y3_9ORYZ|nr:hypothetical protein E2562_017563 [Oryza meyeriana var. granulata]
MKVAESGSGARIWMNECRIECNASAEEDEPTEQTGALNINVSAGSIGYYPLCCVVWPGLHGCDVPKFCRCTKFS